MHEYPKITKCGVSSDNMLLHKTNEIAKSRHGKEKVSYVLQVHHGPVICRKLCEGEYQNQRPLSFDHCHYHEQMLSLHRIIFVRPPSSRHNLCMPSHRPYVAKDSYLSNFSKTTHCTQKYLPNCFIVYLSYYSIKILPAKPLGCFSFSFA